MADRTTGGPAKGKTHGGDQTALPGQAPGKLPFGINNPLSTGAPGTQGQSPGAPDATVTTPVSTTSFGAKADNVDTGAPGGSGASAGVATGATYTKDSLDAYPREDASGGSIDTEAQANKYGSATLPGLVGHQPKGTGAPGSSSAGYGSGGSVSNGSERIH